MSSVSSCVTAFATGVTILFSSTAFAQTRYGAGQTLQPSAQYQQQQQQYQQRQPTPSPTDSWQYKAVEHAAPVVKGIRDCAVGSFAGGLGYGVGGVIAGCPAGVAGMTRFGVIEKAFTPHQAY
jgi:hypothetical protein